MPVRLAVLAMGKCGARELNYVSDVDVVFVAEPADTTATRLAAEMMSVASNACFEVDAALRPEGKAGALVRTLESHVTYYKRWARTWEFQALLKNRPATGDLELGAEYAKALMPMVWNASERPDFVADVQAMRRRVEDLVPADLRERELKLGHGSLRDVEFAVQLLQLVHGKADESLHVQGTVEALTALADRGYVGRDDAANLTASYEFLRLLEHRLQLQRLKRTHTLPASDDEEGYALAGLRRAYAPGRSPGRGRCAAERDQAERGAGAPPARQAVLSPAARFGGAPGRRRAAAESRRGRAPARGPGLRGPGERARTPQGAHQRGRPQGPHPGAAAAHAARMARRDAESRCRGCWRTAGCPRGWTIRPGSCASCATRARSRSG